MEIFEPLRKYIEKNFKRNQTPTKFVERETFKRNDKLYRQILVDVKRGLWRFKSIFMLNKTDACVTLQHIFVEFFIHVWSNAAAPEKYFQGVTDVFELIFASYINIEQFNLILEINSDMKDSDIPDLSFVFKEKDVVVNYCIQVADQIYKRTQFDYHYFIKINNEVIENIKRYDPKLDRLLTKHLDMQMIQGILLKSSISFCLHVTDQTKLSVLCAIIYLESDEAEQAFLLQSLHSLCVRVYAPHFFSLENDDTLFEARYDLFVEKTLDMNKDEFEAVIEVLTNGLQFTASIERNQQLLIQYIEYILDNVKKLKKRKILQQ